MGADAIVRPANRSERALSWFLPALFERPRTNPCELPVTVFHCSEVVDFSHPWQSAACTLFTRIVNFLIDPVFHL